MLRPRHALAIPLVLGSLACGGCSHRFVPVRGPSETVASIAQLELGYSNVFLLTHERTCTYALVDSGSPGDEKDLTRALAARGLAPSNLSYVILTHGHADHAGLGKWLQAAGAKVILGAEDTTQSDAGRNDEMRSQNLTAVMLKPFVRFPYRPFRPDAVVYEGADLPLEGLPGVRVRHLPGHTRGSLVVLVGEEDVIVGDMMLGGIWGGAIGSRHPGDHYYQHDARTNRCNIQRLHQAGFARYYLGHGGPVTRESVSGWMERWFDRSPCG